MLDHIKIQEWREQRGLTQEYVAKKMNISRPTYIQIEKGDRELTLSEAEKLSSIFGMSFQEFLMGGTKPQKISVNFEKENSAVKKVLSNEIRISVPQKKVKKFKEALIYILNKVGAKPNVGETVLYKLLYFIDFDFYEKFEEQLIGATYIKNHHGPTPIEFREITAELEKGGHVEKMRSKYFQYSQKKYLATREADLKDFSAKEIKHIDEVLERLADKNANELSDLSHKDVPWVTAKEGMQLDYEAVFYRTEETTVRSYEED